MPKKSEKYMKTVVAFANGRGGRIVFGVDDKTLNIVGMNPDTIFQTMDSITNAISPPCWPRHCSLGFPAWFSPHRQLHW